MNHNQVMKNLAAEARKANAKLMTLERSGAQTPAQKIALNDLSRLMSNNETRFKYGKKHNFSYNEARKLLHAAQKFNKSVSSTISGMKDVINRRESTLLKRYPNLKPNQMSNLYAFLESRAFKLAARSLRLSSDEIFEAAIDANAKGKRAEDLITDLEQAIKEENDGEMLDRIQELFNTEE